MNLSKTERIFFHLAVACLIAGASLYFFANFAEYIEPSKIFAIGGILLFYYFLYVALRFLKSNNERSMRTLNSIPRVAEPEIDFRSTKKMIHQDPLNPNDMRSSLYLLSRMD